MKRRYPVPTVTEAIQCDLLGIGGTNKPSRLSKGIQAFDESAVDEDVAPERP
jgi:hypothetical protein